jgi:hypothetical protein
MWVVLDTFRGEVLLNLDKVMEVVPPEEIKDVKKSILFEEEEEGLFMLPYDNHFLVFETENQALLAYLLIKDAVNPISVSTTDLMRAEDVTS